MEGRSDGGAVADIAISGVAGWISVSMAEGSRVALCIYAPIGIEAFVRPPMPCCGGALQ